MHTPSIKVAEDWLIRKCVIPRGKEKINGGRGANVWWKKEANMRRRKKTEETEWGGIWGKVGSRKTFSLIKCLEQELTCRWRHRKAFSHEEEPFGKWLDQLSVCHIQNKQISSLAVEPVGESTRLSTGSFSFSTENKAPTRAEASFSFPQVLLSGPATFQATQIDYKCEIQITDFASQHSSCLGESEGSHKAAEEKESPVIAFKQEADLKKPEQCCHGFPPTSSTDISVCICIKVGVGQWEEVSLGSRFTSCSENIL